MGKKTTFGACGTVLTAGLLAVGLGANAQAPLQSLGEARSSARLQAAERLRDASERDRAEAVSKAEAKGWPIRGARPDGKVFELQGLDENGAPLYNEEMTTIASEMSNSLAAHQPPLNATGGGVVVGVWDSGVILETHQEFNNGGVQRAFVQEMEALSAHGTAVAGVIAGSGVNPEVVGAAPASIIHSWYWNDDLSDALAASTGVADTEGVVIISNHSYGTTTGWNGKRWFGSGYLPDGTGAREDSKFGRYETGARTWDELQYISPYFLVFWAAGNDRNDPYPGARDGTDTFSYFDVEADDYVSIPYVEETAPLDDNWQLGGYDTVIRRASGKNIVSVGAIDDALTPEGDRDPAASVSASYSGWGPTDDGRIKPDIVGNGTRLRVTVSSAVDAYGTGGATGTSFSAPNAAGVAAQIAGYARNSLGGLSLRASTIKGLLLHGATDIGRPGPDYQFGWGLCDAVESIEPLAQLTDPTGRWAWPVLESRLTIGETETYEFSWNGVEPLVATICWTDPPGPAIDDFVDDPTLVLINDLDLRVEGPGGTMHLPFILDPANVEANATTGDNFRDNVEQVRLAPGAGTPGDYSLTVSHKGTLSSAQQWYSLALSGAQPRGTTPPPLGATGVTPTQIEVQDGVQIRVDGGTFLPGTQVLLQKDGEPDIQLRAESSAPDEVFTILDASGAAVGFWDVVVERPDGETATLLEGLEIIDPNSGVDSWQQHQY